MPSVSGAQHGLAGASSTPEGRRRLRAKGIKPMPETVAKEFLHADKGKHFKKRYVAKR